MSNNTAKQEMTTRLDNLWSRYDSAVRASREFKFAAYEYPADSEQRLNVSSKAAAHERAAKTLRRQIETALGEVGE